MYFFFFKQKTAYEMRISDWSSDVCSSDLEILGAAQRVGRCEIGAQLHPWVTPPHDEEVNARNSYTGNLPADLQRAKMIALRDAIRDRFGIQPTAYRAGRYGLGPNTAAMLAELGFRCATSVRSGLDYRAGHGPESRAAPVQDRKGVRSVESVFFRVDLGGDRLI